MTQFIIDDVENTAYYRSAVKWVKALSDEHNMDLPDEKIHYFVLEYLELMFDKELQDIGKNGDKCWSLTEGKTHG